MAAHKAGDLDGKGLARKMCPVDRQGVGDLTAAGAAYNEHSLGISVNVQHLPALKGGYIHHHSAQHTDFLIGGQHGLQTGVLQGLILQCGQRHGNGNTVIRAQRGASGAYGIALHKEVQPFGLHILRTAGILFAHHVQMALQNHGRGVFIAGGGGGDENHIVGSVLMALQSALLTEFHAPIADGLGVPGAVGDRRQRLKNFKDPLRL